MKKWKNLPFNRCLSSALLSLLLLRFFLLPFFKFFRSSDLDRLRDLSVLSLGKGLLRGDEVALDEAERLLFMLEFSKSFGFSCLGRRIGTVAVMAIFFWKISRSLKIQHTKIYNFHRVSSPNSLKKGNWVYCRKFLIIFFKFDL